MAIRIEKFNTVQELNNQLSTVIKTVESSEWQSRKIIAGQPDELAQKTKELLRMNSHLITDNKLDKNQRKELFHQMNVLQRALDTTTNKTEEVNVLAKKLINIVKVFAPQQSFELDKFDPRFPSAIKMEILSKLPAGPNDLKDSLKALRGMHSTAPELSNKAMARWINENKISIKELGLSIEELHEMSPYLHYLDLRYVNFNAEEIYKLLENCSNLNTLFIKNNTIKELPEMAKLQKLDCWNCRELTALPEMAKLIELNCGDCPELTALPEMTNLQKLNCNRCPALTALPEMANLQKLDCDYCPALTALPEMAKLQKLDCRECLQLTALPKEMAKLIELNCWGCPALTALPEMANLQKLDCNDCPELTALPEMAKLQKLDCWGCPALPEELPMIPASCKVRR